MNDNPNTQANDAPTRPIAVIPPSALLVLAGVGVLVALFVAFTQGTLNIVGIGALAFSAVCVVVWGVTQPEALRQTLRGRWVTFGGTAFLFSVVLAVAFVLVYVVVRQQGWRADFSQADNFSLNAQGRAIVTTLASDPTAPELLITGFLGTAQGGQRDRIAVLLDDVQRASAGKIRYRFVDPDREPLTLRAYEGQVGSFFITPYDEGGQPDLARKEAFVFANQTSLLEALISASAGGDFRAYVVRVTNGISIDDAGAYGASIFAEELRARFKWNVREVSLLQLATEASGITLLDSAADGEALIILGGSEALPDSEAQRIIDYLEGGGALFLLADVNPSGGNSLATTPLLNDYLTQAFGVTLSNQLVIDPPNQFPSSTLDFVVTDFSPSAGFFGFATNEGLLLSNPTAISVASSLPEGVTVTTLAQTSPQSYSKQGIDFTQPQAQTVLQRTPSDPSGAFVVGVVAENANTGGKVAVITSPSLVFNLYRQYEALGLRNFEAARKALFRVAGYENYAASLASLPSVTTAEQTPLLADANTLSTINFVVVLVIPFGVLGIGLLVGWMRRERVQA